MDNNWKQKALETIEGIFREQFLDDNLRVTESTTPNEIEEWDSLAHVNLLVATEGAFNVRFTAEEMTSIDSVAALLKTLSQKLVQ